MVIKAKRIRKITPYVKLIPGGPNVWVGVANPSTEVLRKIGFPASPEAGESVLPSVVGPSTLFNAEGREIVHKDKPMETAYRTVEWHWTEWHGPDRVERSDFREVPYQRYPRTLIPPPGIELTLVTDAEGNRVVRGPKISDWKNNEASLIHAINVLLELFGECSFYDATMKQFIEVPIKRLNWRVLPPGQRPWANLKQEVKAVLDQLPGGNKPVVEYRLETINGYEPNFAAVGEAGFRGYLILGFTDHNIYVLESLLYGNATYVFGERWEELSQKTKADILNHDLHKARFIHHKGWEENINNLLRNLKRPSSGKGNSK